MTKKLSHLFAFFTTLGILSFLMISCVFDLTFDIELDSNNCYGIREYENGNGDNKASAGESLYLDIRFKNNFSNDHTGVKVNLSTTSEYVTIVRGTSTINTVRGNYYSSLTDYGSTESNCQFFYSNYQSKVFIIKISENCPDGYQIPFVLSFSDSEGYKATKEFTIPVNITKFDIAFTSNNYYKIKEYENGNDDGLATPGESLYLDVKFINNGNKDGSDVQAKLSTTNNYVTIHQDTCIISKINRGNYYTLTNYASYESGCNFMGTNYEQKAFKFSLSLDCPAKSNIPFIITFTDSSGDISTVELKLPVYKVTGSLDKNLWGSWIRMDTGTEYYIDTIAVYESSQSNKKYKKSSYQIDDFVFDGDNVIRRGSTVFFRKGGASRDFTMNVAGFSDSDTYRAISGSSLAGISGSRKNKNNQYDEESVVSASDGKLSFTKAVADDIQEITVRSGSKESSISVAPAFDGQNIGTIPLVEADMYGFKTTYSINSDAQGFCYGNSYKTYTLKLEINNIGSEICKTSYYEISCADPGFIVVNGELEGNFSSVEPGKSKTITLSVKYGSLTQEYIDVPVSIAVTDSKYLRTWNDTVTIRFYKGVVALKVNARNFEGYGVSLKGFLMYPDGRSKRFTVGEGSTQTVLVPWSSSDYVLAFSGATATSELAYSFAFDGKATVGDLSGAWKPEAINAYENNDSYTTAYNVYDMALPVKAYLYVDDIDFYTVNVQSVPLVTN